jgi:hypothetical protein
VDAPILDYGFRSLCLLLLVVVLFFVDTGETLLIVALLETGEMLLFLLSIELL